MVNLEIRRRGTSIDMTENPDTTVSGTVISVIVNSLVVTVFLVEPANALPRLIGYEELGKPLFLVTDTPLKLYRLCNNHCVVESFLAGPLNNLSRLPYCNIERHYRNGIFKRVVCEYRNLGIRTP